MFLESAFSKSIQFCIWFIQPDSEGNMVKEKIDLDKNLNLLGETYIDWSRGYKALDSV